MTVLAFTIENLRDLPAWDEIDRAFADFIVDSAGSDAPELFFAAAAASFAVRQGHSCCDLAKVCGHPFPEATEESVMTPELPEFRAALRHYPGQAAFLPDNAATAPLIIEDGTLLFLNRYHIYESILAAEIRRRLTAPAVPPDLAPGALRRLCRLFETKTPESRTAPDFQQFAAFLPATGNFTIITGGPGTGKTTVTAAALALELTLAPERRIVLCAPTGKAQARLAEAVRNGAATLNCSAEVASKLASLESSTIHALLKLDRFSPRARRNPQNPIPADTIVVDECSMVPLALMAKLFAASRPEAKFILIGDKDQLAPVEAGTVLGDLCASGRPNVCQPENAAAFLRVAGWQLPETSGDLPLSGRIAALEENYRSAAAPAISRLAAAIRRIDGDDTSAATTLADEIMRTHEPDFEAMPPPSPADLETALDDIFDRPHTESDGAVFRFRELKKLAMTDSGETRTAAFAAVGSFKMLCATRGGVYGTDNLNALAAKVLGLGRNAPGTPVIVLTNDPVTGLKNGDAGIIWRGKSGPRVWFPPETPQGCWRSFAMVELPACEPAFAITVHKSQGSGFANVLAVMPEYPNRVLSRELIYTAITRSEKRLVLWSKPEILATALARRVTRQSGLRKKLASTEEV
ncbi:MAG: exodeoxyribonuclease V subunit alpha [Victivallaceae bacterium]|nr:exodeoxyribonuclease V subunit alpha [Victivallaceae bacterium]